MAADGGPAAVAGNTGRTLEKDSPKLLAVLKEMKNGLDTVRAKVQFLTEKVRKNDYPTVDGLSYLEAKHLLLLGYCHSIVYYLLRKAKGLPIQNHPVVNSLVEIRLFLEKVRPIDKKLEYQVQKLTKAAAGNVGADRTVNTDENGKEEKKNKEEEDPLKYRPNPDMLVSKTGYAAAKEGGGVYRPPKFAPMTMDEDKISKQEKQALRREKELLRQAKRSGYMKEIMDDFEDRPEEIREVYGAESRDVTRYLAKREELERQEEEHFVRAPITKRDKQIEKHLKKSRNGLLGLADDFYDDIRMLPLTEKESGDKPEYMTTDGGKLHKKRKRH